MCHEGAWWVLVDITLRMLKPRELFNAQGFPARYVIDEIPDPKRLFADGVQAADPLALPRIPLSATAQVRMCGNSVSPPVAEALVRANFAHEALIYRVAA
jgi:DNA (cytosine-5)-methyltransferase 1